MTRATERVRHHRGESAPLGVPGPALGVQVLDAIAAALHDGPNRSSSANRAAGVWPV